ncbi:GM24439 [Drosophila sechellia]|uniref:GM24439 n=1 Tax=Drosophila sechellia TaxID=7238 RepID=B4HJ31_DROSE|nr:GM24439 [Drosophila sechellia]
MPGSGIPRSRQALQQDHQVSPTPTWWSLIEKLSRTERAERPSRSVGGKCLKCQSGDSISSSISNATGSGGEIQVPRQIFVRRVHIAISIIVTGIGIAIAIVLVIASTINVIIVIVVVVVVVATRRTLHPHRPPICNSSNNINYMATCARGSSSKSSNNSKPTTASPLTPQQHPTVAAATSATSTTTTRRSRLEFILYTEVYQVDEDSVSTSDFHPKSNVGSDEPFWQNYGK